MPLTFRLAFSHFSLFAIYFNIFAIDYFHFFAISQPPLHTAIDAAIIFIFIFAIFDIEFSLLYFLSPLLIAEAALADERCHTPDSRYAAIVYSR
jgi:hypothetical protein